MRKTFKKAAIGIGMAALLAVPAVVMANIQGDCSVCHTMHNSEQGQPVALVLGTVGESATPNEVLLRYDCILCHANPNATSALHTSGSGVIPQVYGDFGTGLDGDLAGGNFAYITGAKGGAPSDRKGHNVIDFAGYSASGVTDANALAADADLDNPPGFSRGPATAQDNNPAVHTFQFASKFTCAGKSGCHGQRNRKDITSYGAYYGNGEGVPATAVWSDTTGLGAISGTHHYNVGGSIDSTDAQEVYSSYRFLYGTEGFESDNWANTLADHNEYAGKNNVAFASGAGAGTCSDCHEGSYSGNTTSNIKNYTGTMTNFCETCHSNFHSSQDGSAGETGSFLRHPADFIIPDKGEYALMAANWNPTAPVARDTSSGAITAMSGSQTAGTDLVMCLSCHVAHASPNEGMLRFDYATMLTGQGANGDGCFNCHTTKDVAP